jgi:hypothetical protein
MKSKNPHGDDGPLDALLQEWQPRPSLPPRFQEQVWRRIERAEAAPIPTVTLAQLIRAWLAIKLPRPALAAAYMSVLLVIGAGFGWSQARQESIRVATELGARYAKAVDPYQSGP